MKIKKRTSWSVYKHILFLFLFFLLFSSCFGVNTDIILHQNGSGTIVLEYQISKMLDSLGKLDGNERWNTIPVGRADFERTLDRLPEIKLLSFSSKEDEKNLTINAKLEFATIKGLLSFLDARAVHSSFSGDANSGKMIFTLIEGSKQENFGLNQLISDVFQGYKIRMSIVFPSEGNLTITDNLGKEITNLAGSEVISKGKKVSFSFPLYEVLSANKGIKAEFCW